MSNREAAPPLFTINGSGWLEYAPLRHHKLPSLVYANSSLGDDETDAVFVRRQRKGWSGATSMSPEDAAGRAKKDDEEDVMFRRRLYRLDWAGMNSVARIGHHHRNGDDSLPCELLQHWSGEIAETARLKLRADGSSARMTMLDVMALRDREGLLEQLPESVAYHIAVARQGDPLMCPVANLPGMVVRSVIDARFALDANYQASTTYLKWLAETHWEHPLLQGFDTAVSEHLTNISTEATRLYFYMLGDTLYDKETQFYARGPVSQWWDRLACYLFWVGRTGMGLYSRFADWPDNEDRSWKDFTGACPGIVERIQFYRETGYRAARAMAHADGKDPAYFTGEFVGDDANLIILLPQLEQLFEERPETPTGMTARGILEALYPKDGPPVGHQELRDCIEQITGCRMGERPDAVKLGKYFQKQRGCKVLGRTLEKTAGSGGAVTWLVRRVEQRESS